jgi:hypothetical protein
LKPQHVLLDRLRTLLYIAAGLVLAGFPPALSPLVTTTLAPADRSSALSWVERTVPRHNTAIRFRFQYEDAHKRWTGRGTARIAPPDSLRFDYSGPLGLGSGAAVVVGDSEIWAEPPENFRSLIPAVRMLWAGLGVVRPPTAGAVVSAMESQSQRVWRFAEGSDTLDYVATDGGTKALQAEWRQEGKIVAQSKTELDAQARPNKSRIFFPEASARLELSVDRVDTAAVIPTTVWHTRR